MPRLAEFEGIVIRMYAGDHNPPHVHVEARGRRATVTIADLRVLAGRLGPVDLRKTVDWMRPRRAELARMWLGLRETM